MKEERKAKKAERAAVGRRLAEQRQAYTGLKKHKRGPSTAGTPLAAIAWEPTGAWVALSTSNRGARADSSCDRADAAVQSEPPCMIVTCMQRVCGHGYCGWCRRVGPAAGESHMSRGSIRGRVNLWCDGHVN